MEKKMVKQFDLRFAANRGDFWYIKYKKLRKISGVLARRKYPLVLIIFLGLLAFLNIYSTKNTNYNYSIEAANDSTASNKVLINESVYNKYLISKPRKIKGKSESISNSVAGDIKHTLLNVTEIRELIYKYNEAQTILNENTFGPLQNDSLVIVVQVHERIKNLQYLITSLAQARDISQVLLIFSHDLYDEAINELVKSIHFCKVMQIFYPNSIQTHPNEFPGIDPSDCLRDATKEQALKLNCTNAQTPDTYGHYREAGYTQIKHHWWWKANRVFDQLKVTRNHSGLVLFLEEDHYVAEDFIYLLHLMQQKSNEMCPNCNILSLGTYLKLFKYTTYNRNVATKVYYLLVVLNFTTVMVEITAWASNRHNMGISLNRTTFHKILKCADYFCLYDDYNWDWSLQHVSEHCLKNELYTMVAKESRIFHVGECGFHHKKNECDLDQIISKVQHLINNAVKSDLLYPNSLLLKKIKIKKLFKARKVNGGWSDKRDQNLCFNMVTKLNQD